jgi:hypothetical protein
MSSVHHSPTTSRVRAIEHGIDANEVRRTLPDYQLLDATDYP